MRIAFLGDVHGCVQHAVDAVNRLDVDAAIQVGDLGAYASYAALPQFDREFIEANPEQGDLFGLLDGSLHLECQLPIYFITGNHDDARWLQSLHHKRSAVPIDPLEIFWHVADGSVVELAGARVGFLGGVEWPEFDHDIDLDAAAQLADVDVLVTHDGPYGMPEWQGIKGSVKLRTVIDDLQPRVHVNGHHHRADGPRQYGRTTSYALAQLVPPSTKQIEDGSIGVLDTQTYEFTYVT